MGKELVENFIYNDDVQNILSQINNKVMDFNILEITGMGTQEIKHSNILGWLFDNSEHNLEYQILENFLKKVIEANEIDEATNFLKHYVYLPKNKRNITIYREKNNIDLLIVDDANKVVITIENKVYASERADGEDGGQLQKYFNIVNDKYKDLKNKYFIYLTIDQSQPIITDNQNIWLCATHEMIGQVVEDAIQSQNLLPKAEIILTSYVDLLKRRNIMENKGLEDLCEKIWLNKEYAEALNILIQHKTTITKKFYDNRLEKEFEFKNGTIFLKLQSTDKIYEILELDWNEIEEAVFDITCEYENEDIVFYFSHHALYTEIINEEILSICNKIKNKKSKKYEEIRRYKIDDLVNKGEEVVLNDMKEIINKIDTTLLSFLEEIEQ